MADPVIDKAGASPAATPPAASSGATTTGVTSSGTASEALLKAVSSAESGDNSNALPAATKAGDTTVPEGDKPVTSDTPAIGVQKPAASADGTASTDALPEARAVALTRNARTQLQTYLGKELGLTSEFGDARPLMPNDLPDLKTGMTLLRELRADATSFFLQLAGELGYELPASGSVALGKADYSLPKPSLISEDGKAAYSADDMAKVIDAVKRELMDTFSGQIKPLNEAHQRSAQSAAREQINRESRAVASSILTEARTLPNFVENEQAILARVKAMDPAQRKQLGAAGTLYHAYTHVLKEKVLPTYTADAEKRVRDENAKKAAGSAIVSPSGAHGDAKKPVLNTVNDLARHMEQLANVG